MVFDFMAFEMRSTGGCAQTQIAGDVRIAFVLLADVLPKVVVTVVEFRA